MVTVDTQKSNWHFSAYSNIHGILDISISLVILLKSVGIQLDRAGGIILMSKQKREERIRMI